MKPFLALIAVSALIAGYAVTSGAFAVGPDTYQISSSAITSFGGSATATKTVYGQATDYCSGQAKRMELVNQTADAQFAGATVDMTFRCLAPK
jgi:hypothetical protein